MWISARQIISEVSTDLGLSGDSYFEELYTWLFQAVRRAGGLPEYMVHGEALEIDTLRGAVILPEMHISTRKVHLCRQDGSVTSNVGYSGNRPMNLYDPDGCCSFYRKTSGSPGIPRYTGHSQFQLPSQHVNFEASIGEDNGVMFFTHGDPSRYKFLLIEYNAFRCDKEGLVMVPMDLETSTRSYIEWKFTARERKLDRTKVPSSDVQLAEKRYLREKGADKGKAKTPSVAQMGEWALGNWGIRLSTPKLR